MTVCVTIGPPVIVHQFKCYTFTVIDLFVTSICVWVLQKSKVFGEWTKRGAVTPVAASAITAL